MTDMTTAEARTSVERAMSGLESAAAEIVAQIAGRAWVALGYDTWDVMREAEYGGAAVIVPRTVRSQLSARLASQGLSQQQIGDTLGVTHQTVSNDLRDVANFGNVPGTRTDSLGREQPRSKPHASAPAPQPMEAVAHYGQPQAGYAPEPPAQPVYPGRPQLAQAQFSPVAPAYPAPAQAQFPPVAAAYPAGMSSSPSLLASKYPPPPDVSASPADLAAYLITHWTPQQREELADLIRPPRQDKPAQAFLTPLDTEIRRRLLAGEPTGFRDLMAKFGVGQGKAQNRIQWVAGYLACESGLRDLPEE